MKITKDIVAPSFRPFTLTILVERPEDAVTIGAVARANCRIPDLFSKEEYRALGITRADVHRFLDALAEGLK